MKKKLLIGAGVLAGAAALGGVWSANQPHTSMAEKKYEVIVVHKDGTEKKFQLASSAETAGEAMEKEGLIQGEKTNAGMYVTEADGEKAVWDQDKAYWCLYINNERAATGVDAAPLEDGAVYTWKYTVE